MDRLSFVKAGVVFAAAIAAFAGLPLASARPSTEAAGLADGRSLYNAHCASCHGRDGRSNTPRGRETEADDISGGVSVEKTIRVVTNGRGEMPAFRRRLTKAQIESIARYVARL
jgi:cytochrome c6